MGRRRPIPHDFAERFVALGWAAKDYYNVETSLFSRWLDECGRDELRRRRAQHRSDTAGKRRMNYVLGKRLSSLVSRSKAPNVSHEEALYGGIDAPEKNGR